MLEKLKDLKARLLIHAFTISVVALLVYFSFFLIPKLLIVLILILLIQIGNYEFMLLAKAKGMQYSNFFSWPASILFPFLFLLIAQGYNFFPIILMTGYFVILGCALLNFSKVDNALVNVSLQSFSHIYITIPLSCLILILFLGDLRSNNDGRLWLAYLICVVKGSDIGGYFFGSMFGKRYFVPKISPKKTIEGLIGGLVFSISVSLGFYCLSYFSSNPNFHISLSESILLALILSAVSQLGDLVESLFKRDANVKDSNSIPGIGGVLDLVDSLLFASPLLLAYLLISR